MSSAFPRRLALKAAVAPVVIGASGAQEASAESAQQPVYDLLLRGGHVIDPKNGVNGRRDVAVRGGQVAEIRTWINPRLAKKIVDVPGMYVTPGLVDMHTHLFFGPGSAYADGGNCVPPDGFTLRAGVTTAVDAGSVGWENFDQFKKNVIDRSKTRVLAFVNIVGKGMAGGQFEQDLTNMLATPAAEMAAAHRDLIIGIKTAHYEGPDWTPVERSVQAGEAAGIPVMVDFGRNWPQRPLDVLLTHKLRPGDIYAHMYSGLRGEQTPEGRVNPGMWAGRRRGVLLEVGHGGGSFGWKIAVPALREGLTPDLISTDLHITSMNSGMKDMANVMSKFLSLGMPLNDVIAGSTWWPAKAIGHPELGHLSVGATADIAVFSREHGRFGLVDSFGMRMDDRQKLVCELTLRAGAVAWDLNGRAAQEFRA
nr:amidohydrolase/deacetylase family metallohydrolase [Kibdelosporangium sp. MJ126-NF4]CEL19775.1 amidohydrolase [Kibdelosporangium sp. MJ126-NF4]CTQ97000.1 amidohydrolase [Kibdelosporangium sp. MJ126-NF4]